MTFRKFIFWLHLLAGLAAGLVIAVMSFTGATLAFEKEIIRFAEDDVFHLAPPTLDSRRLSLDELLDRVRASQPGKRVTSITVSSDGEASVTFALGREATIYADPSTGTIRSAGAPRTRAFLAAMLRWHRYLALSGDQRPLGKAITGACNTAFLFLAVSGLWLWWPRKWRTKGLKRSLVFLRDATGKARDWNWHNVIGFWSLPVLIVLSASGMVISYRWAGDRVNQLAGETPSAAVTSPAKFSPAATDVRPPSLTTSALLFAAQKKFPSWETITLNLSPNSPASEASSVTVAIKLPHEWPRTTTTTLTLDTSTGATLKTVSLSDLGPGRRARIWLRFLHTGEALGWPGQLIAALASLGTCVLVYTGFALAWHRFFIRPKEHVAAK